MREATTQAALTIETVKGRLLLAYIDDIMSTYVNLSYTENRYSL